MGQSENREKSRELRSKVYKRLLQVVVQTLLIAAILLVSAGRWNWFWVWLYLAVGAGIFLVNATILPSELIAERGQRNRDAKRWDKVIGLISVFITLGMFVVAGLDERFGWPPPVPLAFQLTAVAILLLTYILVTWAMVANKFFSAFVRIQTERGHSVATAGPYRYVRHPGYAGGIISWLTTPFFFSSTWTWIPTLLTVAGYIIRTVLEDRFLQEELPGYREYASEVRYRLFPGIW